MTVPLHHLAAGPADAPVVVLGPSIGTGLHMWDRQIEALSARWRVVAYDTRGHGRSPVSPGSEAGLTAGLTAGSQAGPTTVDLLADDVLALLDRLGVDTFAYCGLSLGGAIGQALAARVPRRTSALVLCCTSARFADAEASWRERAARVRREGTAWLVEPSRERWFTPGFADRDPAEADRLLSMLATTPAEGYAACCEALALFDGRPLLKEITAPTLVVAGEQDPATPVEMAEEIAAGIEDAALVVVPEAAHLANVERPDEVTGAIANHLERNL